MAELGPGRALRGLRYQQLVRTGNWKALSVCDLTIAATAERHGAIVLHYDGDFDMIASVTGQRTAWVAPAGTAD
ncbi:PIN domain-containing protein [Streptomyces sp. 15-116A]|uniref:PIN domain-containing protein n=1 Tax=Streptomyces sp. 15-116A TaxID=2259035 RepID=UPI0037DA48DE